ncbi:MAG: hypothetical protein HOP22_08780 [Nitrospiraceae bacterium]|nr:hypothetical protein [Nitrospiraceae bacterium]
MKIHSTVTSVVASFLFLASLVSIPVHAGATTLGGSDASPKEAVLSKGEVVAKYISGCRTKPSKEGNCDKIRKDAVEILREDLHTLGSSAQRTYMPALLDIFKSNEPELRIAAADAIGMIGPQDSDVDMLAPLANDPVPDVRRAVSQMIFRGKGSAITLLGQRTQSMQMGLTPETPPDPGKFKLPVVPASTYLFYTSDATFGRLSYIAKNMTELATFFKGKTKGGPMKLDEFQDKYRYQLQDEQEVRNRASEERGKQLDKQLANMKPDATNPAYMEKILQAQSANTGQLIAMSLDMYRRELYEAPTVYVLEERQIGQRTYPTKYAVLYQDLILKRPGYRLSWLAEPDEAIKAVQTATLAEEKQDEARKKEDEALKKRQEALDNLTKKKDEQEKSKFKKGQADLEKELGF